MTIWLYCLFGKEHQLMPFFLRYYAPQVDRLVMLDGDSDPQTKAMILTHPHAVIQATPFRDSKYDDIAFKDWIAVKYKEARGRADWVIIADVDEFLYVPGKPLRAALEEYRTREIYAVLSEGYQMIADEFPEDDGRQLTEIVTRGFPDKAYGKMSCFLPELDVTWSVGRHSSAIRGLYPTPTGMKLLHYRWFGDHYHVQRNARNNARRSKRDIATGSGYHTAPDYTEGRYSAAWFKAMAEQAEEVTNGELLYSR